MFVVNFCFVAAYVHFVFLRDNSGGHSEQMLSRAVGPTARVQKTAVQLIRRLILMLYVGLH